MNHKLEHTTRKENGLDKQPSILEQAFFEFEETAKRRDAWSAVHPYGRLDKEMLQPEDTVKNNAQLTEVIEHRLPALLQEICLGTPEESAGSTPYAWSRFVEALLLETSLMERIVQLDASRVLSILSKLVLSTDILSRAPQTSLLQPLTQQLIQRKTEFLAAYRSSKPDEAVSSAAILTQLVETAPWTKSLELEEALSDIRTSWIAIAEKKPVLAEKILRYGPLYEHWEAPHEIREQENAIWRTFSQKDGENTGYQVRKIARDAIGGYESDSSLFSIASIPLDTPLREYGCESRYVDEIYDYVTGSAEWRANSSSADLYDDYVDFVQPHLSEEDQQRFEELRQNAARSKELALFLQEIKLKQEYVPIVFQPVATYSLPITIISKADRFRIAQIHHPAIRASIERDSGLALVDLRIREQMQLVLFLSKTERLEYNDLCSLFQSQGINAARTFLALESDAAHGERILAFAGQAKPEVAAQVFEAFARIADKIDLSAQELAQQLYHADKTQPVDAERVRSDLIQRGGKILLEAETSLKQDPTGAALLHALEKYEADTVLFVSLFKGAFKGKETDFSEVRDLRTELAPLHALSERDREQMQDLLEKEWSKKPLEYLFPETGTFQFFLLRRQERIIGFIRIEDTAQEKRHANFLCVDHSLRGSGIGENIFREAIERGSRKTTLEAEFDAALSAGSMYIERLGFVGTGLIGEERPSGYTEWITMEHNHALLERLPSRRASTEQIRSWVVRGAPKPFHLVAFTGAPNTMELGMVAAIKQTQHKDPRYVLSRYLLSTLPDGREERVLVFDIPTPVPVPSPSATKTRTSDGASQRSMHPESPARHHAHAGG